MRSRGFGFEGACAKLTPIENASIKSDNAATCGGYQHHRRGNPPNLVAPLKDFIDIPPIDFNSKCILFAALRGQVGCHAGYLVTLGGLALLCLIDVRSGGADGMFCSDKLLASLCSFRTSRAISIQVISSV